MLGIALVVIIHNHAAPGAAGSPSGPSRCRSFSDPPPAAEGTAFRTPPPAHHPTPPAPPTSAASAPSSLCSDFRGFRELPSLHLFRVRRDFAGGFRVGGEVHHRAGRVGGRELHVSLERIDDLIQLR